MTQPMTRELIHVPFRDSEVLAVEIDGKPWIVLRPILSKFGLDESYQIDKVQRQPWASVAHVRAFGADGRLRQMVAVDSRTLRLLLATIRVTRVNPEARLALIAYQKDVATAVEAHWTCPRDLGYVYAVRFSTGVVKVGRTQDATKRLTQHEREAERHAAEVVESWLSPPHLNWVANEDLLIGYCRQNFGSPRGDEYFMGADYASVLSFAKSLPFRLLGKTETRAQEQLGRGVQLPLELEGVA